METNKSPKLKGPGFRFNKYIHGWMRHWFTGGAHRFLDFGESSWDGFGGRFLGRF